MKSIAARDVAPETVAVFAYGALMQESGVPAVLADYELEFTLRGAPPLEPSFATLTPRPGARTHGVLIALSAERWRRRRAAEHGFTEVEVEVVRRDGARASAVFLRPPPEQIVAPRTPSARHARTLRTGAERNGLPDAVVERYRALEREGPTFTLYLRWLKSLVTWLVPKIGLWPALIVVLSGLILSLALLLLLLLRALA